MQYILLILCLIQLAAIVWLVMQVQKLRRPQDDTALRTLRQEIAADTQNQMQMLGNLLSENQRQSGDYQAERLEQMERGMDARLRQFESRVGNLERSNAQGMEQIRSAVAANLHRMQTQQQDSLAEIQSTVNEKLAQSLNQKIGQSFQLVSSRLEQVYQGLGEMQTLAVGVGDLKRCCPTSRPVVSWRSPAGSDPAGNPCPGAVRHGDSDPAQQPESRGICSADAGGRRTACVAAHRLQVSGGHLRRTPGRTGTG